jgi:catechol 2,3-dioxygenase-like lactoylglutathione lyase family enzyme
MPVEMRICVDVPDLEAGIAFYRDGLGLEPGRRFRAGWVEMVGASSPIDLIAAAAGTLPSAKSAMARDYERHWTPVHLDFVVADLDAGVRKAIGAGATLDRQPELRQWGRLAVLADPFGNGFCLLELRGRGYDEMFDAPATD